MEKRISYQQFQQVKSAAKMIDPLQRKLKPIEAKIKALAEEYKGYQGQIESLEEGIVKFVGFHVSDLVKKVIDNKVTKYIPTDIVSYDTQHKQYVITVEDTEEEVAPEEMEEIPTTEDVFGSDFDIDKENVEQAVIEPADSEIF